MARIRRQNGKAMEQDPDRNRKMENMKALMMEVASSNPLMLPYKDLIEEKIQKLLFRSIPDHPTYAAMIHRALQELDEKGGSTEEAISNFIVAEYDELPPAHATFLKHHLKRLTEKEEILCTSKCRYMLTGPAAEDTEGQQLEGIKGQKQTVFGQSCEKTSETLEDSGRENEKGSANADKESQGQEEPLKVIDDQIEEEQLVFTEECNKEMREHTDMIMGQTDAEKAITVEYTNDKGGQENKAIRQQTQVLKNPTEVIVAKQEQLKLTYEATETMLLGEEEIQASDGQYQHDQQVDDIGYRNRLEDLKRLQEQQKDICCKISELNTIRENLTKSMKDDDPTASLSSGLTNLRPNQSCSLLFSKEQCVELLGKVNGISTQLIEMMKSFSVVEASKLNSEPVVGGQQNDFSVKNSLPTTTPFQGRKCMLICGPESQDKKKQKRSYCRRGSGKSERKTMAAIDIHADSFQLQEKPLSQLSHSKRHPTSEGTIVKLLKRKKSAKVNPELLEQSSVGQSGQIKLVEGRQQQSQLQPLAKKLSKSEVGQEAATFLEKSCPTKRQQAEHLTSVEQTQKSRSKVQRRTEKTELASRFVSEQSFQRKEQKNSESFATEPPESGVHQLETDSLEPSPPARPQTEEHLRSMGTTQKVNTRMRKKRFQKVEEPVSRIVLEQSYQTQQQRQGRKQCRIPQSQGKKAPESAVENDSCLADLFTPTKRFKKNIQLKLKELDKEQQEQLVRIELPQEHGILTEDATMDSRPVEHAEQLDRSTPEASLDLPVSWNFYHGFKPAIEGTGGWGVTNTEMSSEEQLREAAHSREAEEPEPRACSELLGEKSSEEPSENKQIKGLQQRRLLRSQAKKPSESGETANVVEELAPTEVKDDEHLKNTETKQKSKTKGGKKLSQQLEQNPNEIASEQLCHPLQQGRDPGQPRQLLPHSENISESVEIGAAQLAGFSSPEHQVEQNIQLETRTVPNKEIQGPVFPPTGQKRRGRPPKHKSDSVNSLSKKNQQQKTRKRGRPCKPKTDTETSGKLKHGKKETRGRPRKIKAPSNTCTDVLRCQYKDQQEECEAQGNQRLSYVDKQPHPRRGAKAKTKNDPTVVLLPLQDKGRSEEDQAIGKEEQSKKAAAATNSDPLRDRDTGTLSPEQQLLQPLKSAEGRITRSKHAALEETAVPLHQKDSETMPATTCPS